MNLIQVLAISSSVFFLAYCSPANKTASSTNGSAVVFFDDFSGASLDRNKWNVVVTGGVVNNEQQAYVDSAATIYLAKGAAAEGAQNGALILHPQFSSGFVTKDGKKFDFISGRINTRGKVEFTYGTAAARIKMTAGSGLWPAFWALGAGRWPESGEIDIMEYVGEPDWTSIALHGPGYSGETPLVNKVFFTPDEDVTQWHIYSVDWTKDSLLFKVDGKLIYRATRPMVEHYGKWTFDNPKYLILNFALGGAYPFKTNGVKEPYNGMPAATVQLIKEGKSKMLVDWVRITKNQ
jgi:beta-glucanase (GH16 family)